MAGLFSGQRRLPNIDPQLGATLMRERPGGFGGGFTPPRQPQRRPGLGTRLLGEGWAEKANALGALLQGDSGAVGEYHEGQRLPLLQQVQRETEFADWQRRKQWERANPEPRVNDTVADYEFIRSKLGEEGATKFLRNRADPPRYVQGPDGQFYPVQTAQPPTAPVGRLTPIEGGPGGSPSGAGFRP